MVDLKYRYIINLKLIAGSTLRLLQDEYPGATDISLASRDFTDYNTCTTSCKRMMDDVVEKLNNANMHAKYVLSVEVNPIHTGQDTMSKNWKTDELARLWAFDEKMRGAQTIAAVCQARIFKTDDSSQLEIG